MVAERRGLSSGSFSSSQSQSTISSTLSSTTKRISPSPVPPERWSAPGSRPGCSTWPGSPRPWPAPWLTAASARRRRACSRNLTGTITVRLLGPVIRSDPASSSGSPPFTASRTFWLCRSQSRAPGETRSYQGVPAATRIVISFLGEQRRHVVERLAGAVRVVAVLVDQALLHHRDLLPRLVVGAGRRAHQAQHVAALLEEILLDRVVQRRVAVERELLAALEGAHRLAHHFLAERALAGLGDADLLLDVAQEALVGLALLAGDRVAQRAVVERRLDLVEILVEQLLRLVLERDEQCLVHVLLHPAVVEILAHRHQEVDPLALLLAVHAHVALDRVLERDQHLHRGQAFRARLDDGAGERVDDEARRDARQALVGIARLDLLHLGLRDALDVVAGVEADLLCMLGLALFALGESRQHRERRRHVQRVRIEGHLAECLRRRAELAEDARRLLVGEGVGHLDDHHAIEQRLVFRLLQELAEHEALLDRMVIIHVPYTLSYKAEDRK